MNKHLLPVGFTFALILTSLTQAQTIPLTFDPAQSTVEVTVSGVGSSSQLSGTATLDIQNSGPPSGSAQITQLDVIADDGFSFGLPFGVSASISPGDLTVSLVTPGAPGIISGTSFDQLENLASVEGDIVLSGIFGGALTTDLSTLEVSPYDSISIEVTQSGDIITVEGTFTISEMMDLGTGLTPIDVEVNYVASGAVPNSIVLGDVNMDGSVNFLDISHFIAVLTSSIFQAEADTNEDGEISFFDISPFIALLTG